MFFIIMEIYKFYILNISRNTPFLRVKGSIETEWQYLLTLVGHFQTLDCFNFCNEISFRKC